jgi:hypothetical protein
MLVDASRESYDALLICDRCLPQVDRAPIGQSQGEAERGQTRVAIEQRTALVGPRYGTALSLPSHTGRSEVIVPHNPEVFPYPFLPVMSIVR